MFYRFLHYLTFNRLFYCNIALFILWSIVFFGGSGEARGEGGGGWGFRLIFNYTLNMIDLDLLQEFSL